MRRDRFRTMTMGMLRYFGVVAISAILVSGCSATNPDFIETANDGAGSSPAGATSTGEFVPNYSTKFDQKWPTDISREELVETALFNLFADLDSIKRDDCAIRPIIFTGDPLLPEHEYLIEEISTGMINSYCDYLTDDITVVSGSYDYLKQVVAEEQLPSDDFGGICGNDVAPGTEYAGACAGWGTAWTGISLGSTRNGESFIEERRLTIAAHELFHIIQDQIHPESEPGRGSCRTYDCTGPVWFFEGSGEFMGRAMTQYFGLQNYATFVPTDRSGLYLDAKYLSDLDFLTDWRNRAFTENYYSGQIAIEYMIANEGLLAVLEIWELMAEDEYFPNAFEQALGISLDDFYEKFRVMHTKFYEEGGYCNSTLGCQVWNEPTSRVPWFNEDGSSRQRSSFENNEGGDDPQESSRQDGEKSQESSSICHRDSELWWVACQGSPYPLPIEPENSDHGFPTDYERIPKVNECAALEKVYGSIPGFAATENARETAGAYSAHVSTQYYAALATLDENSDGVVCSFESPD